MELGNAVPRAGNKLRGRYRAGCAVALLGVLGLYESGTLNSNTDGMVHRELLANDCAEGSNSSDSNADNAEVCGVFGMSGPNLFAEISDEDLKNYTKLTGDSRVSRPLDEHHAQCVYITVHQSDDGCNDGDGHFVQLFSFGFEQSYTDPQTDGLDGESYISMYYCTYGRHKTLGSCMEVAILVLMFLLLGSTSEEFFCPALASLSQMLGLKPRVAGVTLLALGNGAPDVFSIKASVAQNKADMAVGEVTGAGNFVTTAVVGAVALTTEHGLKARGMFIRDLCMLVIATGLLLHVLIDGEVTFAEAISFLVLYVFYVSIVVIGDRVPPMLTNERPAWRAERARQAAESRGEVYVPEPAGVEARAAPLLLEPTSDGETQSETQPGAQSPRGQRDDKDFFLPKLGAISMSDSRFSSSSVTPKATLLSPARPRGAILPSQGTSGLSPLREQWATKTMSGRDVLSPDMAGAGFSPRKRSTSRAASFKQKKGWAQYRMRSKLDFAIEWSEMSPLDKAIYVFESPFTLARSLTIPVVVEADDDEEWDSGFARMFMILNPPFALPFMVNGFAGIFGSPLPWNSPFLSVSFGLGLVCCPLVWLNTARKPPKMLIDTYVVVAFLNALFWIGFVADDLVALLSTLGGLWGIPSGAMGLTVLAMGNSLGDMAADLAVARSGKPNMAVTACYAGPFFNLCIGIGVSFALKMIDEGNTVTKNKPLITVLFFSSSWLILIVLMTIGAACFFKFQLPRQFGYVLIASYGVFCVLAVAVLYGSPHLYQCTTWGIFNGDA